MIAVKEISLETIASVVINIPTKKVNRAFSYVLPPNLQFLEAGWRVLVPFGSRNVEGFIIETIKGCGDGLKSIIQPLDEMAWFDDVMLKTATWMSEYYLCSLAEAMRLFIPGKAGVKTSLFYQLNDGDDSQYSEAQLAARHPLYQEVCSYLADHGPAPLAQIQKQLPAISLRILNYLVSKKILTRTYRVSVHDRPKYELAVKLTAAPAVAEQFIAANSGKRAQQRLLTLLLQAEGRLSQQQLKQLKISRDTVNRLAAVQLIALETVRVARNSYEGQFTPPADLVQLQAQQQQVLAAMLPIVADRRHETFLLHGVTGSGKTQVYLEVVAAARAIGRQAIVLVPEIALTSQIVARFQARFGDDVVVMHSRLSLGERNDAIWRLRTGQAGIVIGARSAVFAPLSDLGVIVMDEEHEFTYKQEETPRYHTRDVALTRAALCGAMVVLGSATPAVETYYHALQQRYTLLQMPVRIDGAALPDVQLVDMRQELKLGRRSVISAPLRTLIEATVAEGRQIILLLNRRGHSTFVMCRECGHVISCTNCAVSLVYHKTGMLRCHYCQTMAPPPDLCPECSSRYIRYFGTGTQRLEDELTKLFPNLKIIRMDHDTTGGKKGHEDILQAFAAGRYDILLGTQMVAKGHDVKNVTAVGIITADSILNLPDFRAAERTFSLVTQAAGRAGRGDDSGQVIIQTYHPEHYAIESAARQQYADFYQQEVDLRRSLFYPPFSNLVKMTVTGASDREVRRKADDIAAQLAVFQTDKEIVILGPFVAPIAKIANVYRMHILIKAQHNKAVRDMLKRLELHVRSDVQLDIDPVNVM